MDLGATLNSILEYDIKKHCHINSNEDGDRFVGIKADSQDAIVYFPIGYELPENDAEIRADIKHLIQVLSEFTTEDERLLAVNKCAVPQSVNFPINAFKGVIEYYFSIGGSYYVEKESTYKNASAGKQDWSRTVRKHMPLVQTNNGVSSFIFTQFEVRASKLNDTKEITQINKFCVYEAFKRLGWLYVSYMPEEPGPHPDVKTSIRIIQSKLASTNDDKKRALFHSMINMLEYLDEQTSDKQFYFGTDDFERVWEKLIDKAFGEKDKDKYLPRSRWLLSYGKYKEKRPLIPDTIMIYDNKYYILDAKYYKYGCTSNPDHLPDGTSINKQITYGEYLEKHKKIGANILFNAFIMPYNKSDNFFGLSSLVGNIGSAIGDWRHNKKYYERIQGIVMDMRHLMYHYCGNLIKEKALLAQCIESGFEVGEAIVLEDNPIEETSFYTTQESSVMMVAEPEVEYGVSEEKGVENQDSESSESH